MRTHLRRSRRSRATGLATVVWLGGASLVVAQQEIPTYSETMVVSATAGDQERSTQPAAATVIESEEIARRQYPPLGELLATVAGLTVATAGPTGQQTSLFTRGAESDQTLLLWNGVPLNSPYFGAVNWQFIPTEGVERVEVVRGPFSALWGGGALGGVVQVFSGSRNGGSVQLEGGENGLFRGGLAAGQAFGAARFDVTASSRRGDSQFANGWFDGDDLTARLGWQLTPGSSLAVLARANDSASGIPFGGTGPNLTAHIDWRERELAVPFTAELGRWRLDAQLSHVRSDYAFRDPADAFGFTASDTEAQGDRGRLVAAYRPNEGLTLAFGSELERVEASDASVFGVNLDGASQRTWAAFAEGNLRRGAWSFDLGVRRDDNDVYGAETSLRAGASWALNEAVRLKASYGEAFRAPTLGELFYPGSGNRELQPERGRSVEVGLVVERGGLQAELTAFRLEQRDLIDFDLARFTFANVSRAQSAGLEGSLRWQGARVAARLAATYLDTENRETGEALLRRPRLAASASLAWRLEPVELTAVARFVGERPDVDPATFARRDTASYLRADLGARWRLNGWLAPFTRVENLADRRYQEVLGYPASGRTWVGGLAVSFQ